MPSDAIRYQVDNDGKVGLRRSLTTSKTGENQVQITPHHRAGAAPPTPAAGHAWPGTADSTRVVA